MKPSPREAGQNIRDLAVKRRIKAVMSGVADFRDEQVFQDRGCVAP